MRFAIPGKRLILVFHRWVGLAAAVFLLLLALTGLFLNHADKLGLHEKTIQSPLVGRFYNMAASESIQALRVGDTITLAELEGALYFNGRFVDFAGELTAGYQSAGLIIVATGNGLVFITEEGELVETVEFRDLPFSTVKIFGKSASGKPVIQSVEGTWTADPEWLSFEPFDGSYSTIPVDWVKLDAAQQQLILQHFNGKGPSLYRVLLDLHSGRLFGWGGRTVMDLTAFAIIFLVVSGITGWIRRSRRDNRFSLSK